MASALFSQSEREALLNLLAIGLYADGRLSLEEDEAINAELAEMEWESATDKMAFLGDALTEARQMEGEDAQTESVAKYGASFTTPEARSQAWESLETLLGSDGVSPSEETFLEKVRKVLQPA